MNGEIIQYLPIGGLAVFVISSLIAVKVGLAKRPTFTNADEKYKNIELCDEIHKNVDEKLDCIPEIKETVTQIKTTLDIFIKNNGKK